MTSQRSSPREWALSLNHRDRRPSGTVAASPNDTPWMATLFRSFSASHLYRLHTSER